VKTNEAGIVLRCVKYNDRSLIARVFCHHLGHRSFIVSVSPKSPRHLFQVLQILEFSTDNVDKAGLLRMSTPRLSYVHDQRVSDPFKTAIGFFMAELLDKTIAESYVNSPLYAFLTDALELLDKEVMVQNYLLWWLRELAAWYGFPLSGGGSGAYFNLNTGQLSHQPDGSSGGLSESEGVLLSKVAEATYAELREMPISGGDRRKLVRALVHYLSLHLDQPLTLKSLDILYEVFA
jgi:DNA repair protein RecO (recombination protein O)